MDFKRFKKNVWFFTDKLKEKTTEVTDWLAKKFSESAFVLKTPEELDTFIKKSKNFTSKETWKTFEKRVLVIFWDSKTDFYKDMLKFFPILFTKSWVANDSIKLVDINSEWFTKEKYKFDFVPWLIVYQNEKFFKEIPGQNNIKKIVKNTTMDIDKLIDEIELDKPEKEENNEKKENIKEEKNNEEIIEEKATKNEEKIEEKIEKKVEEK